MDIVLENGVSLPDIPEGVLDTYPYCIVVHVQEVGNEHYALHCANRKYEYMPSQVLESLGAPMGNDLIAGGNSALLYICTVESTAWENETEDTNPIEMNGTITVVWANHDIMSIVGVDMSTFQYIYGDVYFEDNSFVYADEYAVETSIIRGIARQIRRIVGVNDKLVVSVMESLLKGVEAQTYTNWLGIAGFDPGLLNDTNIGVLTSNAEKIILPPFCTFTCNDDDNLYNVEEAVFPNATHIGEYTFALCTTITKISAPLLESIGERAFYGCSALTDINGGVLNIAEVPAYAFYGCESLKKLDLPIASSIGDGAFQSVGLETLILRKTDSICTIEDKYPFHTHSESGLCIYVPASMLTAYKSNANWRDVCEYLGYSIRAIEDYPDICGTTE